MHIIPAIDLIEGKCVRLTEGDYTQMKIYNEDPLEVAKSFEEVGIRRLHLVDLDGAKAKHIVNWKVLDRLASQTSLQIDFGGGLKSDDDVRIAFECGARQITGGTVAAKDPTLFLSWLERYGAERVILGADARDGKIAVSGWQEDSEAELIPFIQSYSEQGIEYVISTDIRKDGRLGGPAVELYRDIREELPEIKLIASGGVSSLSDLEALRETQCFGAIIGKAIYEGRISLKQLGSFI